MWSAGESPLMISALGTIRSGSAKGREHERPKRKSQKDSTKSAAISERVGRKDQKDEAPPERAGLLLGGPDEEPKRRGKMV